MTDDSAAPAWLAALTPAGDLTFHDVSALLGAHPWQLLARLREQVGYYVDRVRVHSHAGWLLLYFGEPGHRGDGLPYNRHARDLVLDVLGMDLGCYRGTFLILGEDRDREAGLTEAQRQLLRDAVPSPEPDPEMFQQVS